MVGRDEAYGDCRVALGVGDGPSSIVFCSVDVSQPLRDVIVEYLRVVLLHYAFKCGLRFIVNPVRRCISHHLAVCHAQGEVRVRVERLFRLEFHLPLHVFPVKQGDLPVQPLAYRIDVRGVPSAEFPGEPCGRVVGDRRCVGCSQRENPGAVREQGFPENGVGPSADTAVLCQGVLEALRLEPVADVPAEGFHDSYE